MAGNEDVDTSADDLEERYDFEEFGPEDFEEMTPEEWSEAFDPDSWVTGSALLERVEAELRDRIERRDVFAVVERITNEGEECLLAYSDEGYALIRPSGEVEGFGTVLRDVKPTVALCSMPEYEVEPVTDEVGALPDPAAIDTARSEFGNKMLQFVGFALLVSTIALIGGWLLLDVPLAGAIIGVIFGIVAVFLLFTVANARLSTRYRAEGYRQRLRSIGLGEGERPSFVPVDESEIPDESGVSEE